MKARIRMGIAAVAAIASMVVGLGGGSSAVGLRLMAYGITSDGNLMAAFKTDTPQVLDWVRVPTGYVGDTSLIGMDFRQQNGKLYAVGNKGGIYTVSLNAGSEATLTKVSQLTATPDGTNFGVDFNPAADRLRVVSDTGQNLRHDLSANSTIIDPPLTLTGVSAAAYTNNDLHAGTATTLFDIVTSTAQVAIQSPANNGTLAPTGTLSCEKVIGPSAGLDIFSDLDGTGRTMSNVAFGAFSVTQPGGNGTVYGLYTVDLLTANCTKVGAFPLNIADVAVALDTN
jgi:uncharacterized protein DUF4394